MTRLLLTLLALLTGLAAQVSPAQARLVAGAEVSVQAVTSARRVAIVSQVMQGLAAIPEWRDRLVGSFTLQLVIPARTVLVGIDRARE